MQKKIKRMKKSNFLIEQEQKRKKKVHRQKATAFIEEKIYV